MRQDGRLNEPGRARQQEGYDSFYVVGAASLATSEAPRTLMGSRRCPEVNTGDGWGHGDEAVGGCDSARENDKQAGRVWQAVAIIHVNGKGG